MSFVLVVISYVLSCKEKQSASQTETALRAQTEQKTISEEKEKIGRGEGYQEKYRE